MAQNNFYGERSCFGPSDVVLSERELMLVRTTAYYTVSMMLGTMKPGTGVDEHSTQTHLENSTMQVFNDSPNCLPATLSVKELADVLGLSMTKTYALVRQPGFPCVHLGKNIRIPQKELNEWLHKNSMSPEKGAY